MTEPEESVTVPVSVAPETCAYAGLAKNTLIAKIIHTEKATLSLSGHSVTRMGNLQKSDDL
jgi:hypothetical protein